MTLQYLRETPDGRYLFVMDRRWNSDEFRNSPIMPHEAFLDEVAPHDWYYGGNRYLSRDRHPHFPHDVIRESSETNRLLVVTSLVAATALQLSEHVIH